MISEHCYLNKSPRIFESILKTFTIPPRLYKRRLLTLRFPRAGLDKAITSQFSPTWRAHEIESLHLAWILAAIWDRGLADFGGFRNGAMGPPGLGFLAWKDVTIRRGPIRGAFELEMRVREVVYVSRFPSMFFSTRIL